MHLLSSKYPGYNDSIFYYADTNICQSVSVKEERAVKDALLHKVLWKLTDIRPFVYAIVYPPVGGHIATADGKFPGWLCHRVDDGRIEDSSRVFCGVACKEKLSSSLR